MLLAAWVWPTSSSTDLSTDLSIDRGNQTKPRHRMIGSETVGTSETSPSFVFHPFLNPA